MDQREYGMLIAKVEHLVGEVGQLRESFSAETAKLHGRIDQFMQNTASKAEHQRLEKDVGDLWTQHRQMRERVEIIGSELQGATVDRGWMRDLIWLALILAAGVSGYGVGAF
ncbi:hypothetical protein [Spectribacter hydrogenoxidans]|uniref:Membrane-anchored ribosome-binding protein, inhibits growth in stationary phase, ElaB/YqjD/DUF883 family n=1 Tax=Spectribacter hydrogenoxidans TaxID=3075608 RepID=A0ABU3C0K1_9GAMM|nr:hypothetical protein [Salinisphaera sp. W335]MDT0635087.1 hypothetical protein [Salinisphaera sp. W335]